MPAPETFLENLRAKKFNAGRNLINANAASLTLTKKQNGSLIYLNRAAGVAVALPAITSGVDDGLWFEFYHQIDVSGGNDVITAAGANYIEGKIESVATDAANAVTVYTANGSSHLVLTNNGTTKGGLKGGRFRLESFGGKWTVNGRILSSGTLATPFS